MSNGKTLRVIETYENKPRRAVAGNGSGATPEAVLSWIDMECPSESELIVLTRRFALHGRATEDGPYFHQQPRLEDF